MKLLVILLIGILLIATVSISGCLTPGEIQTKEQAGQAVSNVSQDIGEVSDILNDIDNTLG